MPTYSSNAPDIGQMMPGLMAIEGIQGRQSQERIDYNVRSQFLVQMFQWAGVIFAICSIGWGLFRLARSLLWVVSQFSELTAILAAGIIGAFLLIVGRVLRSTFDLAGWRERAWHSFAEWLSATTIVLLALSVVQAVAESWDWKEGTGLLLGFAAVIAGALLAWRFSNELRNPAYPAPPVIDLFRDWIKMQMAQQPEQPRGRLVPYSPPDGNGVRPLSVGAGLLVEDDSDLIEFTQRAASVGLSRRMWAGQVLPATGNEVTRVRYDALIARLVEFGYVVPGGEGRAARWTPGLDPWDAVAELRRQAEELAAQG